MSNNTVSDCRVKGIPSELAKYPQWVGYYIGAHGQKIPIDPDNLEPASSVHPETWSTANLALGRLYSHSGRNWDGLGFVLTEEDPYLWIDFDNVVYGVEVHPEVSGFMAAWGGWWQVSASGTGLHHIVRAPRSVGIESQGRYYLSDMPMDPTRVDKFDFPARVEVFFSRRWVPFTGRGTGNGNALTSPSLATASISASYSPIVEVLTGLQSVQRNASTADPRASAGQVAHGERHVWLAGLAGKIARTEPDRNRVEAEIERAAELMADPLPSGEVRSIVNWALNLESFSPSTIELVDIDGTKRIPASVESRNPEQVVTQVLALDTVGYECRRIVENAFCAILDESWAEDPRKWYKKSPIYKHLLDLHRAACPHVKSKRCAPTAYGRLPDGNIVGSQLYCGDWLCARCGPYRLTEWWYSLTRSILDVPAVYHNVLDEEQWAATESSRQRLRAHDAKYRAFRVAGGWETISSEPLSNKHVTLRDSPVLLRDRPQLLLEIFGRIRRRTHKRQRLVAGSRVWGPPKAAAPQQDYEFLGVGPSPDEAAVIVSRELSLITTLTGVDEDIDGTRFHWSALILMQDLPGLADEVQVVLGLRRPRPRPSPVLVLPDTLCDRLSD